MAHSDRLQTLFDIDPAARRSDSILDVIVLCLREIIGEGW